MHYSWCSYLNQVLKEVKKSPDWKNIILSGLCKYRNTRRYTQHLFSLQGPHPFLWEKYFVGRHCCEQSPRSVPSRLLMSWKGCFSRFPWRPESKKKVSGWLLQWLRRYQTHSTQRDQRPWHTHFPSAGSLWEKGKEALGCKWMVNKKHLRGFIPFLEQKVLEKW